MTDFGTPGIVSHAAHAAVVGCPHGPALGTAGGLLPALARHGEEHPARPAGRLPHVRRTGGLGAPLTYYAIGAARSSSPRSSSS